MSLYGALFSGVSGLVAQSSAMGAISDNITNVSTVGYKSTEVHFQTLVTKQTSGTFYSAGGVQSKPRQSTDVQGLLQASTSQTDIAVSGDGFFVVNSSPTPGISDEYLYTRSGAFYQDDQGYLKNTQGHYLQGWPTDASGTIVTANKDLTVTNKNIISTDYMETINLNRVGGTAAATSTVAVGANLPVGTDAGDTHKTDVQFFDSLGQSNNVSINYVKTATGNQWDVGIDPPPGTAVATLYDGTATTPLVYDSRGQIEFTAIPAAGSTIEIGSSSSSLQTYTFNAGSDAGNNVNITGKTLAQVVAALVADVQANDGGFAADTSRIAVKTGNTSAIVFNESGIGDIYANMAATLSSTGTAVTKQTGSFTVKQVDNKYSAHTALKFPVGTSIPADAETITINGKVYEFDAAADGVVGTNIAITGHAAATTTAANVALMVNALQAAIVANDTVLAVSGRVTAVNLDNDGADVNDTLLIDTVVNDTNDVDLSAITAAARPTSGQSNTFASTTVSVSTTAGMVFDAGGSPSSFGAVSLEILGFTDGAHDMNNAADAGKMITLDFGTTGEYNGMTQIGEEFTPAFITQNGSKFGTFAGVTIGTDGLVTALFDNGETRKIFKIPMATFVNPNQLEGKSGNVWSATQFSGDYTLREPDSGPAGQVIQSALEASTVDIGTEFTNMIVVQRAYSASTKIISTADAMLEELMRVKR